MKPFIPSWLDDLGLLPAEFRVLAHLWRRAGPRGECFPAAASIIRTCRIHRATLWRTLRALENRGLIARRCHGRSNTYYLSLPSVSDVNRSRLHPVPAMEDMQGDANANRLGGAMQDHQIDASRVREGNHNMRFPKEGLITPADVLSIFNGRCSPPMPAAHMTRAREELIRACCEQIAPQSPAAWFTKLFEKAAESDFLCGRVQLPRRHGRPPFIASFDWLISQRYSQRVLEGTYDNRDGRGVAYGKSEYATAF